MVVKDLGVEVENLVSATNPKSPTVWSDKASTDEFSPIASSSITNSKNEKPFSTSEQITESGSAYEHSEEGSARSPGSPGSTLESPFLSAQFDVHDISPRTKESYRYNTPPFPYTPNPCPLTWAVSSKWFQFQQVFPRQALKS